MAQIFLLFQKIILIPMPNSTITASQYTYPQNTLSKRSRWGKEIHLWLFEQNESDIKFNFVFNSSAYMRKISSKSGIDLGSTHFYL